MKIRIATRRSPLAIWQTKHVAEKLNKHEEISEIEIIPMTTRGDKILDRSLQKIGGKGLFIKELETAMSDGKADLAVHSVKDVPSELPFGFCLAATLARGNYRDALITKNGENLNELKKKAIIGTSSLRRQAQLKILRPDFEIKPLRGNIDTRLKKLKNGDYDAIVLAAAGLERLKLENNISHVFSIDEMLPAAAQGVLGIECLDNNIKLCQILESVNDAKTFQTTFAERIIARALNANCHSPIATLATIENNLLKLTALVAKPNGEKIIKESISGDVNQAEQLSKNLAVRLIDRGAKKLLQSIEAME